MNWCLGLRTTQRLEGRKLLMRRSIPLLPHNIMSRSFASNYYGKIETPLLLN